MSFHESGLLLYLINNQNCTPMEYIIDRKWKWVECNLVIKRLPQKDYQEGLYESLEAEVQLISEEPDIKNFQSDIIMDKTFEFQEVKGFIWHKSWYIPEILVKLSSKITRLLKQESHIKKMYCEMLSGYPFKKDEHFYIEQIRLDGENVKEFNKKGEVCFSNIKFSQTSFNKNKNRFSLILVIYTFYKQNQKSIVKSYISSPIHVDSRKQARKKISANTFMQDEINLSKFINGLEGAQKLVNESYSYQELLSINGFIKYYTAANIRFKIKHPYYIGYHFSNVFDVYYNSDEASDPATVLDLIYESEGKQSDRAKIRPKPKKQLFTDNKQILKKSCPKILLFMIKNTPKQCFLIKEQLGQSDEKIVKSDQKVNFFEQNNVKLEEAPQLQQELQKHQQCIHVKSDRMIPNNNENNYLQANHKCGYQGNNNVRDKQVQKGLPLQNRDRESIPKNENLVSGQIPSSHIKESGLEQNSYTYNSNFYILDGHIYQVPLGADGAQNPGLMQKSVKSNLVQMAQNAQQSQKVIKQEENSSSDILFAYDKGEHGQIIPTKNEQLRVQVLKQEQAIRKIYSIFDSWKFNFIHLKKSDGGLTVLNKKWVHIPKDELLQSFKRYANQKLGKHVQNQQIEQNPMGSNGNANQYLTYDLHQVIVLQKSKHTIKLQQNQENYAF